MKPFRAAIVGTGVIATNHITALHHEKERVEVVGAVDINSEKVQRFCEEYGIANAYTDMQIMLDEQKPNLIHICTPPSTHFELCVKALRHGSHVICEKPLVGSLDEVDRLQALERET